MAGNEQAVVHEIAEAKRPQVWVMTAAHPAVRCNGTEIVRIFGHDPSFLETEEAKTTYKNEVDNEIGLAFEVEPWYLY